MPGAARAAASASAAVPAIHLPFHDPHGEPLESFLAVRDDIRTRLVAAVREKLVYSNVPAGLRGLGITFVVAGLMSVAFMMFSGIQL